MEGNTSGPARVFDSEEDVLAAILDGKIGVKGDVSQICYRGPRHGTRGTREMPRHCRYETDAHVELIADGRFSGGTRKCYRT